MQQVNFHAAKTHLSKLIEAALAGEKVVIAKGDKPVVHLAPVQRRPFQIGLLAGQLGNAPDFLTPMDKAELAFWEAVGR